MSTEKLTIAFDLLRKKGLRVYYLEDHFTFERSGSFKPQRRDRFYSNLRKLVQQS